MVRRDILGKLCAASILVKDRLPSLLMLEKYLFSDGTATMHDDLTNRLTGKIHSRNLVAGSASIAVNHRRLKLVVENKLHSGYKATRLPFCADLREYWRLFQI